MDKILGDQNLFILSKALDAGALNHRVISNNIANVNTPGFKRSEVSFKDELKALRQKQPQLELTLTHPNHSSPKNSIALEPKIVVDQTTSMRADGNNVDIDREMAKLSANSMEFQAEAQLLQQKLALLRSAIQGR